MFSSTLFCGVIVDFSFSLPQDDTLVNVRPPNINSSPTVFGVDE